MRAASAAPRIINVSSRASFLPNARLDLADLDLAEGSGDTGRTRATDANGATDPLQHVSTYGTCQTPVDCPAYAASKLEQLLFTCVCDGRSRHLSLAAPEGLLAAPCPPVTARACRAPDGSRELHKRLGGADSRALVVALHPGLVATELFRYSTLLGPAGTLSIPAGAYDDPAAARALNFWGFKTASQGAQTSIYAATSPELTSRRAGGRFLRDCADADDEAVLASSLLGLGYTDEALSRALWRRAEQLSGAAFRPEPLLLKSEKSATGSSS